MAADLRSQDAGWETTDVEGSSRVDLPDGCRESLCLAKMLYGVNAFEISDIQEDETEAT
jgi:hypothetical protein